MNKNIIIKISCFGIFFCLCFVLLSCTVDNKKSETVAPLKKEELIVKIPAYEIISKTESHDYLDKISYDVKISHKLTEKELDLIADQIKAQTSDKYKSIFISYYLPSMEIGIGSWALSTRGLAGNKTTINIEEPSKEAEAVSEEKEIKEDRDIIGRWTDSFGSIYTLYKKHGSYYLDNVYTRGKPKTDKISVKRRNGVRTYNVTGDSSEFFVIQNNGDLYYYDSHGDLGMVWRAY